MTVNGITIRALISGNGEKAIVFVHGNSCDASFWAEQLNDDGLQKEYQLIAFDLPGHGKSGRHHSYQIQELASVIPELITQLQLKEYILAGLSFGTSLISETATALKGCKGFLLASPNITSNAYPPSTYIMPFPEVYAMAVPSVSDEALTKFAEQLVLDISSPLVNEFKKSYLQTDPAFRVALGNAIQNSEWSNEFENLINTKLPCSLIFGKDEKILNIHYLDNYPDSWDHSVHVIESAAHFVNCEQINAFNKLLGDFAEKAFR